MPRTYTSHSFCFICKVKSGIHTNKFACLALTYLIIFWGSEPFGLVSEAAIVNLFISRNIFIPFHSRFCKHHFDDRGYISKNEIKNIRIAEERVKLTGEQLSKLLRLIRERDASKSTLFDQFQNIDKTPPKLIMDHIGFTKEELSFILCQLRSLKNLPTRTKEQALAIYLTWLKTGIPQ